VGFLKQPITLFLSLFFWVVTVPIFVPKSPMVEFAGPCGFDDLAGPSDLFESVERAFSRLVDDCLKLGCDETFQEIVPADE
jgi:hypothetical protein